MTTRRHFVTGAGALAGWSLLQRGSAGAAGLPDTLAADLARIELESGGRLGVAVLDTGSGARVEHRGNELFPVCSTFKLLAAAAVLKRVDEGKERLDRRIVFQASDIVVNSLFTKERVGGDGMTLADICEAAMIVSDNTAGNLILATLGGPAGLTLTCVRSATASRASIASNPTSTKRRQAIRATPRRRLPCLATRRSFCSPTRSPPHRKSN
jgi:beta-lactamase class A